MFAGRCRVGDQQPFVVVEILIGAAVEDCGSKGIWPVCGGACEGDHACARSGVFEKDVLGLEAADRTVSGALCVDGMGVWVIFVLLQR